MRGSSVSCEKAKLHHPSDLRVKVYLADMVLYHPTKGSGHNED